MAEKYISIRGARVNNLKSIDVDIPRDKLVILTGLSGSGKSSLAFDTIYAEGHRRFMQSLSSYARMFLGQMDKPDVDSIEGLSPAISIDQKTTSKNPRSTVGTVTEIYDYLRLLYARIGIPHCPVCHKPIVRQTKDTMVDRIMELPEGERFLVLAPVVKAQKGTQEKVFSDALKKGYSRVRVDGILYDLTEKIDLDKNKKHDVEIVVDRLVKRDDIRSRLGDSAENALRLADGHLTVVTVPKDKEGITLEFSEAFACEEHNISMGELEPRLFSFNNPIGACPHCSGIGDLQTVDEDRIIPDPSLTLAEGAVDVNGFKSLTEDSWNGPLLHCVGEKFHFTLDTPLSDFTEEQKKVLLYGSGSEPYFITRYFGARKTTGTVYFTGVVKMIETRAREKSEWAEYYQQFMKEQPCPVCQGARLSPLVLSVTVGGLNIHEFCSLSVEKALDFVNNLSLTPTEETIAVEILKEIKSRLSFLVSVGLDYLTLSRKAGTLSGGEAQRIRLATQIGSSLVGVLYILDEPSIGLHPRDNGKLIATLKKLRDQGNSVIVVEHDEETMLSSDYIVDIGPSAGLHGGTVVAEGTPEEIMKNENSVTGAYLSGRKRIPVPKERRKGNGAFLTVKHAVLHNLRNVSVDIPLGKFVVVTGVSGSGKSSLVNGILYPELARKLNSASVRREGKAKIIGTDYLDKVILIDQSPIGRTPRSNPATYTGVWNDIRALFASSKDAQAKGYKAGRFSFNTRGGRCEACEGDGVKKIEMHFLPDVYVKCDVCNGTRYNRDTLDVRYKGKNIDEVLNMTVEESLSFFEDIPNVKRKMQTLYDVGLGYIRLGQSSTTLSGGEAQRVKLATELQKRSTGKTIYILDEPTTGLHTEDVRHLLDILNRLTDKGNTVLCIEHNLDVIKSADTLIDMGPEGGERGGTVVAIGTPEELAKNKKSHTGEALKALFERIARMDEAEETAKAKPKAKPKKKAKQEAERN